MPTGCDYVDSWVEGNFDRCFQLMECDDPRLFQESIAGWHDLMDFEIVPVTPSKETRTTIWSTGRMQPNSPAWANAPRRTQGEASAAMANIASVAATSDFDL